MKSVVVVAVIALATPRVARAADCAVEADRLRAHLEEADTNTSRWQLAWTIVFGAAAAGQFALAGLEWNPFGDYNAKYRDTLLIGGTKATIGLGSRVIFPLKVYMPERNADRCVELAQMRQEIARVGKKERQSFWLSHIGGAAINLGAVAILWWRHSFATGAISFAYSYPVGLTSVYTMPRASWKLWRREQATWSAGVVPSNDGAMFVLGGEW